MVWQVLVGNVAAVALLLSVWMHLKYIFYRLSRRQSDLAFGLMMGLGVLVSMSLSVKLGDGYLFDLRLTLLAISAIYGGPIAVAVTAPIAVAFRLYLGGGAALFGVVAIVLTVTCALGLRRILGKCRMQLGGIALTAAMVAAIVLAMAIYAEGGIWQLGSMAAALIALTFLVTGMAGTIISYFQGFTLERDILRAALTQAPDYHYVKGLRSEFVVANLNTARRHGRSKSSEMAGLTDFDLFDKERAQVFYEEERRILETGVPIVDAEACMTDDDGRERWYLMSKVPLRNRSGELIGLAGVTRDITESKRLQLELLQHRDLLAHATAEMSDGLAMFGADGRLAFCNQQYLAAFPRSAHARVVGAHITDIVRAVVRNAERRDVSADVTEDWIQNSAQQLFVDRDTEIPMFDGRWLCLKTRRGSDGSALVVASDITAMKTSEEQLRSLAAQMKDIAETDALTGIANRRVFDETLNREFAHSLQCGAPLSLLLIDVDHFKRYNDIHGHVEGDNCLKAIATILVSVARRMTDVAARYGGEEFALILPGVDQFNAAAQAESMRLRLSELAIPHPGSDAGRVTVSVGVATASAGLAISELSDLVRAADAALYRAKSNGRNCVVVHGAGSQSRPRQTGSKLRAAKAS